jgi:hypothetical protein
MRGDYTSRNGADLLPVGEMLGQRQRVGNPAFAFRLGVVDVRAATNRGGTWILAQDEFLRLYHPAIALSTS